MKKALALFFIIGTSAGYAQITSRVLIQGSLGGASGSLSNKESSDSLQNIQLSELAGPWWHPALAMSLPDRSPGVKWSPYKMDLPTALQGGLHIGGELDLEPTNSSTAFTMGLMIGGALMSLKGHYTPSTLYTTSWSMDPFGFSLGYNPPVGEKIPSIGEVSLFYPFSTSASTVSCKGKGYVDATIRLGLRFNRFHVIGNVGLALHKIDSKFLTTRGESISMKTGTTPCLLTGGGFTYNFTPSFGIGGTVNIHLGNLKIKSPQNLFTIKQRFRALESMITFTYTLVSS